MATSWSNVLGRVVRGENLTHDEAYDALSDVMTGETSDVVIASLLTGLAAKGETVDELAGFVDAMMDHALTFSVKEGAIDIVGTGGDQLHTVNVSTLSALTVAACGVPVAKHGSRAATSSVGSADVLEGLGVRIESDANVVATCVEVAGMGFCFAPLFHPGLRFLVPIRRALGFPTAFNVLGPLANPARVRRLILGVANPDMIPWMATILQRRGIERAFLVHGDDGLDELSLGARTSITEVTPTSVETWFVDPSDLGARRDASSIRGGDLATNVELARQYLAGEPGPIFDTVTANAGLALVLAERVTSVADGRDFAAKAVLAGGPARVLEDMARLTNS